MTLRSPCEVSNPTRASARLLCVCLYSYEGTTFEAENIPTHSPRPFLPPFHDPKSDLSRHASRKRPMIELSKSIQYP
jgi:hypothetical protein